MSEFIGTSNRGRAGLHPLVLLSVITAMSVFLSQPTSNSAPVAAMAPVLGVNPCRLILACTPGARRASMMPGGTPPNKKARDSRAFLAR